MPELMRSSFFGEDAGHPAGQAGGEFVRFYLNKESEKVHCRIEFAGDRQTVWDQPVREVDKRKYWTQWQAYEQGLEQTAGQTLLDNWSDINPGSVEVYKHLRIYTVEQLAHLPDSNLQNFDPGDRSLAVRHRQMAQRYLEETKKSAGFDQALQAAEGAKEIAAAAVSENEALKAQLLEVQRRMEDMESAPAAPAASAARSSGEFPVYEAGHGRGATYRLSNGEIVKGRKQAIEAERNLAA